MLRFYISDFNAYTPGLMTKEDWREWAEGKKNIDMELVNEPIDLDFVPPMIRRRLSMNMKMAIYVSHYPHMDNGDIKSVFASRYGEWGQTIKLLKGYSEDGEISPTGFGLSVHNVTAGIYSLINRNKNSYISVAANEKTFEAGIIEAVSSVGSDGRVLFTYSDENAPEPYNKFFPEGFTPLALSCVLSVEGVDGSSMIECEIGEFSSGANPLDFIKFLYNKTECFDCSYLRLRYVR